MKSYYHNAIEGQRLQVLKPMRKNNTWFILKTGLARTGKEVLKNLTRVVAIIGVCALLIFLMYITKSSALQYVNYTSYKYKIQFQYPTDWLQGEKIFTYDPGADISVTRQSYSDPAMFLIVRGNSSELGSNLMTAIVNVEKTLGDIFQYELELPVSQTTIGGQKTATFIYSINDKSPDRELEPVHQIWLTYVGGADYYLILFAAPRYSFSNLENTEIRNQFIKSIKFLGAK